MLVALSSIEGAAEGVSTIIRGKIIPTTLEFIDNSALNCIRQAGGDLGLPETTQAVLIVEVDGATDQLDPQVARIQELLAPLGVLEVRVAATQDESEAIWKVRRAISPSLRRLNPHKFNEDIVVPRSRVPEMIRALEKISTRYNVPIVNFGHAGDGNIHVNVMVDLNTSGMGETVEQVLKEIFATTVALQGSVSGEHGIGTAKQPYIALELSSETLGAMRAIKKALDPLNIMNPGKIFPELSPESPLPLLEHSAV